MAAWNFAPPDSYLEVLRGACQTLLDEPVDDKEWGMTPPTVNAYYSPTKNQIVFPAAILQPPFFDPDADPAINYGGIGGVIGHEITHGFDDQGRKSDGDGKLTDWWTAEDAEKFMAQAAKLGAQYSAIEPLPGHNINGELTMGENIADLGGLLLGLDAYHLSLDGEPAPVIADLDDDVAAFMIGVQRDAPGLRLAGGAALLRRLQPMVAGIAHHMGERILDQLQHLPVELGLGALHVEVDLLAEFQREVADQPR